jgi:hypothetical protein
MTDEYKPRFSFEISEELKKRTDNTLITYGLRKTVMTPILIDLLDMIDEYGQVVIGVLLDEAVKPREIIKSMAKAERRAKK